MVRFFAKRVLVLSTLMSAIAFVVDGYGFIIPLGIFIGGFVAVYKLMTFGNTLNQGQNGKISPLTVVYSIMSQLISFTLLAVAAFVNLRLFGGIVVGLMQVVVIICINVATERVGLTHNNWQG